MNVRVLFALGCCVLLGSCAARYPDDDFVAAANHLRPSVVMLSMLVPGDKPKDGPDDEYATGTVVASGAWGSDIMTVQHAIEGAWHLRITVDNKQKFPARVIAQNADLDIALVRTKRANLPVAELGDVRDAQPGRMIGLLGYPIPDEFDDDGFDLATSLNSGRISSLREDAIEVTIPIVPGESGSPVFLSDTGEIIGIAESRFEDERSIGFALPISDAERFLHKYDRIHGM